MADPEGPITVVLRVLAPGGTFRAAVREAGSQPNWRRIDALTRTFTPSEPKCELRIREAHDLMAIVSPDDMLAAIEKFKNRPRGVCPDHVENGLDFMTGNLLGREIASYVEASREAARVDRKSVV